MAQPPRTARLLAAAAIIGLPLAAAGTAASARAADPPRSGATRPAPDGNSASGMQAATEHHIAALKAQLKITPAEEGAWDNFAAVMRQNASEMSAKLAARTQAYGKMNAVQDLQSYADVTELHAREIAKLVGPFQALYDSFSPDQKAQADRVFHNVTEKGTRPRG